MKQNTLNITIPQATQLLRAQQVVAFPTETVYGLGADATSDIAVGKIFAAKGRPGDNPLIVHIADESQLPTVAVAIPDVARQLMAAFWPGALTIILPKHDSLSSLVTAGLQTVGVRIPSHPIALELLRETGLPLAAPSANISGKPSPTTAQHVADDFGDTIAGIVDGGSCQVGLESTVIDCTASVPTILRPGGVTRAAIEAVIGRVEVSGDTANVPKSPGMKYKHYAPQAPMTIVQGDVAFFERMVANARCDGKRVGLLQANDYVITELAQNLYAILRAFDEQELDAIYCQSFSQDDLGEAVMNRLLKAADGRIIYQGLGQ
ncbi:MAG: L-threonylcarbamoyladenylate synthase [Oscillospiraceae bacterium]|nr:L-threonylcarbamoyladenylate synthase [Oscillospiraceae bacterium]